MRGHFILRSMFLPHSDIQMYVSPYRYFTLLSRASSSSSVAQRPIVKYGIPLFLTPMIAYQFVGLQRASDHVIRTVISDEVDCSLYRRRIWVRFQSTFLIYLPNTVVRDGVTSLDKVGLLRKYIISSFAVQAGADVTIAVVMCGLLYSRRTGTTSVISSFPFKCALSTSI